MTRSQLLIGTLLGAMTLCVATTGTSQQLTVIDLPQATAKSTTSFASVLNVVELPNGHVAVNDPTSRQLILLDRGLGVNRVVLDSTMSQSSYGRNAASIVSCNCREIWFPDVTSRSIITFDETGNQQRVMAAPRTSDFLLMLNTRVIADTLNNLFYRTRPPTPQIPGRPTDAGAPLVDRDSSALLRANFETRQVDTIAKLRTLRNWVLYIGPAAGGESVSHILVDLLASIDEWTVTADGTVAVVRGHDYHIDWIHPDGRVSKSAKLPFDFKRLTDADKTALMDSARTAELKLHRESFDRIKAAAIAGGSGASAPAAAARAGSDGASAGSPMPNLPQVLRTYRAPVVDSVPLERIPDYYPPIRTGAVTSDLDGNVWILPTTSAQSRAGELVYDVVSRDRGLIARVRLPVGHALAGFGRNGVVYLTARDANQRWSVERTLLPRKLK